MAIGTSGERVGKRPICLGGKARHNAAFQRHADGSGAGLSVYILGSP
jgi:hypothetical protein